MPYVGDIRMLLAAMEDDDFGMPLFSEWLREWMYLQGTESLRERLLLIPCDFLITEKQHLIIKESGAELSERGFIELRKMHSVQFSAQGSRDRIHRYLLPIFHWGLAGWQPGSMGRLEFTSQVSSKE